jgi:hypothetical protein
MTVRSALLALAVLAAGAALKQPFVLEHRP